LGPGDVDLELGEVPLGSVAGMLQLPPEMVDGEPAARRFAQAGGGAGQGDTLFGLAEGHRRLPEAVEVVLHAGQVARLPGDVQGAPELLLGLLVLLL
jgi:hypothetical protein